MSALGIAALVVALVVATAVGLVLRARSGRLRARVTNAPHGWDLAQIEPRPEDDVLLLQLSSPICAPCRQTATQLDALAAEQNGLRHVEVDVADSPKVADALRVLRTPTTVAFDRSGTELLRVSGVPKRRELVAALAPSFRLA